MNGKGVSPGIAIGKAYVVRKTVIKPSGAALTDDKDIDAEKTRFKNAIQASVQEIETIKSDKSLYLQTTDLDILDTQIEFLTDPQIETDVLEHISKGKVADDAVNDVINIAVRMFQDLEDDYMKARAADIRDIGSRIIRNLKGRFGRGISGLKEKTIIIAEDLSPSDTITLDLSKIAGFATQLGSKTSHAAIIARSKGLPAVVACGDDLMQIKDDDIIILDGSTGEIIINPGQQKLSEYGKKQKIFAENIALIKSLKELPAKTTDDHEVKLFANISDWDELEQVFENGAEGIGLLRTEFLFMNRNNFPTEEEQFQFYRQTAIKSKNKTVVVRTLDIGGDKQLPYFNIPAESNPFLGYRAIRISLKMQDIFLQQIKAILRAAVYGDLKIMFPMISNVGEVRMAKDCIRKAQDELRASGTDFREIETGIMIEIPSAALITDILADEVDFFSIGTNDLCQYTMAVDRMNDTVSYLYNHFNPGFLRLVNHVVTEAHKKNKHVAMCGEMASDPLATLLLTGMGLNEFSMDSSSIPVIKNIIRNSTLEKAREVFLKVMEMNDIDKITRYLTEINDFPGIYN